MKVKHSDPCCDFLIIGGGPAGSTLAALLGEKGYQVTLLEKAQHPRFHICESLLLANLPLLERLGVRAAVEGIGMVKWGAEFISPWHDHGPSFEFADAWDKSMPYAGSASIGRMVVSLNTIYQLNRKYVPYPLGHYPFSVGIGVDWILGEPSTSVEGFE